MIKNHEACVHVVFAFKKSLPYPIRKARNTGYEKIIEDNTIITEHPIVNAIEIVVNIPPIL